MFEQIQTEIICSKSLQGLYIIKETNLDKNKTLIKKFYAHYSLTQCQGFCTDLENEYQLSQKCEDLDLVTKIYSLEKNITMFIEGEFYKGCCMTMEYAQYQDFQSLVMSEDLSTTKSLQNFQIFKKYATTMAQSLIQIHEKNIVHNDIKKDNFFLFDYQLGKNPNFDLKLADFGYSATILPEQKTRTLEEQKIAYNNNRIYETLAPEQYRIKQGHQKEAIDEKLSDIYQLGLTLFEAFTQIGCATIFEHQSVQECIDKKDMKYFFQCFPQQMHQLFKLNKKQNNDKTYQILEEIFKLINSDPSQRNHLQQFINSLQQI